MGSIILQIPCLVITICDTIKGNESHVGNIQFWFFNVNHLCIQNATFWSKPSLNRTSGYWDMWTFFEFKNIVKHKNLLPLLACNSKSIFLTSHSFPLIKNILCFTECKRMGRFHSYNLWLGDSPFKKKNRASTYWDQPWFFLIRKTH